MLHMAFIYKEWKQEIEYTFSILKKSFLYLELISLQNYYIKGSSNFKVILKHFKFFYDSEIDDLGPQSPPRQAFPTSVSFVSACMLCTYRLRL